MATKTYSEKLRDPRWQRRRLEIMQLDEFCCRECYSADNTLNVHHIIYTAGADPWEYPDEHLVTLCESCHEKQKSVNIKKAFADGGFIESQVEILAFTMKFVAGKYVNTPRANNQALWSICFELLKNNGADMDEFTKQLTAYRAQRNG